MSLFDIAGDAQRAFTVLQHGGAAIVPHSIGYAALGGSAATLRRIFEAKRRGPAKRNAMVGNLAIQSEVQRCTPRGRDIVRAIVEDYDLPLGCIETDAGTDRTTATRAVGVALCLHAVGAEGPPCRTFRKQAARLHLDESDALPQAAIQAELESLTGE